MPLRVLEPGYVQSAAGAFATGKHAGVGGWWAVSEDALQQSKVLWCSEMLDSMSLPPWLCAKETLQQDIASCEGVVQLCLLVGRAAGHQLCDNMGPAASLRKNLFMQVPLSYVLQAVGFHCCRAFV